MKPLPNINDETAMLLRGRQSSIAASRKNAEEALRDAYTHIQSAEWADLPKHAEDAAEAARRLSVLASMWEELK